MDASALSTSMPVRRPGLGGGPGAAGGQAWRAKYFTALHMPPPPPGPPTAGAAPGPGAAGGDAAASQMPQAVNEPALTASPVQPRGNSPGGEVEAAGESSTAGGTTAGGQASASASAAIPIPRGRSRSVETPDARAAAALLQAQLQQQRVGQPGGDSSRPIPIFVRHPGAGRAERSGAGVPAGGASITSFGSASTASSGVVGGRGRGGVHDAPTGRVAGAAPGGAVKSKKKARRAGELADHAPSVLMGTSELSDPGTPDLPAIAGSPTGVDEDYEDVFGYMMTPPAAAARRRADAQRGPTGGSAAWNARRSFASSSGAGRGDDSQSEATREVDDDDEDAGTADISGHHNEESLLEAEWPPHSGAVMEPRAARSTSLTHAPGHRPGLLSAVRAVKLSPRHDGIRATAGAVPGAALPVSSAPMSHVGSVQSLGSTGSQGTGRGSARRRRESGSQSSDGEGAGAGDLDNRIMQPTPVLPHGIHRPGAHVHALPHEPTRSHANAKLTAAAGAAHKPRRPHRKGGKASNKHQLQLGDFMIGEDDLDDGIETAAGRRQGAGGRNDDDDEEEEEEDVHEEEREVVGSLPKILNSTRGATAHQASAQGPSGALSAGHASYVVAQPTRADAAAAVRPQRYTLPAAHGHNSPPSPAGLGASFVPPHLLAEAEAAASDMFSNGAGARLRAAKPKPTNFLL